MFKGMLEYKAGVAFGATGGTLKFMDIMNSHQTLKFIDIMNSHQTWMAILSVTVTAIATGFLGAFGAHIFKLLVKKYKKP